MPNKEQATDTSSLLLQYQSFDSGGEFMTGAGVLCFLDWRKPCTYVGVQNWAKSMWLRTPLLIVRVTILAKIISCSSLGTNAQRGDDKQAKAKGNLNGWLTTSDFNLPEPPLTKITLCFHYFQSNVIRKSCKVAIREWWILNDDV